MSVDAGAYGFHVSMTVTFGDDRDLRSGDFELGGKAYPVEFYPNDGTDNDAGYPTPLSVKAGISVESSAILVPDCSRAPQLPQLDIRSTNGSNSSRDDRFAVSNPDAFASAFRTWCARPVQGTVESSRITPDGDGFVELRLVNPGTTSSSVASAAFDEGKTHWDAATAEVPAGGTVVMRIAGTGISCRHSVPPWKAGKITSNGAVLSLQVDSWC